MFNKLKKNKEKQAKKKREEELQAIEDAKSPEQKEYEKRQRESLQEAKAILDEAEAHLNELGWRIGTQILPFMPGRRDVVASMVDLTHLPWETKLKIEEMEKAKAESDAKKNEEPTEQN